MENKKKRWPVIVFIIFILVIAALYVYLYLIPDISGSLTETYTVVYGDVEITDDARCIVAREEKVYTAPKTGSLSYYSKENEKTRKGFTVADVYSSDQKESLKAETTGYVSYYIDGKENYFVPASLGALNVEDYCNLDITPNNTVRNETKIGDGVYKLITSNTWYLLLVVPESELGQYTINSSVQIRIDDDTTIKATAYRFLGSGDTRVVVCSTKQYYEDFAKIRTLDVTVVTKSYSGLLVPKTAIATVDEKQGVYVLGVDEEYVFKEVQILTETQDNVLVSSEGVLRLYDEILRDSNTL